MAVLTGKAMVKKITIVNRHYPPNPGITGESAWDLAKYLIDNHGFEVHIVCVERSDDGGGQIRQPVGIVHSVRPIYKGKSTLLKLMAGMFDGLFLALKARRVAQGPIIVMTSPPLLPLWASFFLKDWLLWSMDLFPEGFAASGQVSRSNPLYRWVLQKTYQKSPQKLIALGPNQAAYIQKQYQTTLDTILLPCGVLIHHQNDEQQPSWKKNDGKIYFGYCGNLAKPHSADFLKSFISHFDPQKHQLVLAIYGEKAADVLRFAQGREGIVILNHVVRSQLHFIDVHLVSLKPEWTHIAVPSKAVSSICVGASMIFCGNKEADTWWLLKDAAWQIDDNEQIDTQLTQLLPIITFDTIRQKKENAQKLLQSLRSTITDSYEQIAAISKN
jgi:hypothetical protein